MSKTNKNGFLDCERVQDEGARRAEKVLWVHFVAWEPYKVKMKITQSCWPL